MIEKRGYEWTPHVACKALGCTPTHTFAQEAESLTNQFGSGSEVGEGGGLPIEPIIYEYFVLSILRHCLAPQL